MKWYKKYISTFEQPFDVVGEDLIAHVKRKLNLLQSDTPLASVVVIGYNEESRLFSCLWSLSDTNCKYPIEIIGVDNNSIDRTAEIFEKTGIRYYTEFNKSCGYARNRGLQEAKGKYYICIDSDTMYPKDYLNIMIEALQKPGIIAVSSRWSYVPDKNFPALKMMIYEKLRDINLSLLSIKRPEFCVRGLVFAYEAEYGRKVGYKVHIIRGEDGAMANGLKKYGKIAFVTSRKARAVTCTATLRADGNIYKALLIRILSYLKRMSRYFTKKSGGEYEDQDSNIVKH